jgi:drug/metabolite transporter (DMT)-like permease
MPWIIPALLAPLSFAAANLLDSQLTNRHFRSLGALVIFGAVINAAFVLVALPLLRPSLPSWQQFLPLAAVGLLEAAYLIPYYLALRHEESSVVTAFFALSDMFVPLLAFLFLGEKLRPLQYLGFVCVIAASAAFAWRRGAHLRSKTALMLMVGVALILSVDYVVYKHALDTIDWRTAFFWPRIITLVALLPGLAAGSVRRELISSFGRLKPLLRVFIPEEAATFLGSAFMTIALAQAPATVLKGIGGIQPLFVLLLAIVFGRWFPNVLNEATDRRSVARKVVLSFLVIVGVIMIAT